MKIRAACRDLGLMCSIGITTGEVFCGNVGSPARCEYAITGDTVNLAARFMAHKLNDFGLLVDSPTHHATRGKVTYEPVGQLQLKVGSTRCNHPGPRGLLF